MMNNVGFKSAATQVARMAFKRLGQCLSSARASNPPHAGAPSFSAHARDSAPHTPLKLRSAADFGGLSVAVPGLLVSGPRATVPGLVDDGVASVDDWVRELQRVDPRGVAAAARQHDAARRGANEST